jgi:hypothetical protein
MGSQLMKPSKECTLTREELKGDGKKLNDLCENCLDCGVERRVRWHPSERDLAGNKINK